MQITKHTGIDPIIQSINFNTRTSHKYSHNLNNYMGGLTDSNKTILLIGRTSTVVLVFNFN